MKNTTYTTIILCCGIVLMGCTAQQQFARQEAKALKHLHKAINLSETVTAAFTRDRFPCVTTGADTFWTENNIVKDSLVYVTVNEIDIDTSLYQLLPQKRMPVRIKTTDHYITKTVVQKIKDSAAMKLYEQERKNCNNNISALQIRLKHMVHTRNVLWMILLALLITISIKLFGRALLKNLMG